MLDVWDWDAGKSDDWIGHVKFECSYFIQGYMEGPALGRSGGWGGGVLHDGAAAAGMTGSPYTEQAWWDICDKRGRAIKSKMNKRTSHATRLQDNAGIKCRA